jgi:glucosyltransferase
MEQDIISVIVTTYNQEDTIARTLDSILMQQCHLPIEIVIGEDCSTDSTLTICRQYAERHPDSILLLANEHNKGMLDNYFDCILASHGRYIADCAGDDFWTDPLKLEKEVNIMISHPDVTLVHTDWTSYDEATGRLHPSPQKPFTAPFTKGSEMLEAIITQRFVPVIHLCTSLYRRDIILRELAADPMMFRNPDFGCEDVPLSFVMAMHGVIAYLPETTVNYSQGHESVSSSVNHQKMFRFTRQVLSQSYYLSRKYDICTPHTVAYFSQRLFELGMHAFRAHSPQLYAETLQAEQDCNIRRNDKTRLLLFIMRHEVLWRAALLVRNAFVAMK